MDGGCQEGRWGGQSDEEECNLTEESGGRKWKVTPTQTSKKAKNRKTFWMLSQHSNSHTRTHTHIHNEDVKQLRHADGDKVRPTTTRSQVTSETARIVLCGHELQTIMRQCLFLLLFWNLQTLESLIGILELFFFLGEGGVQVVLAHRAILTLTNWQTVCFFWSCDYDVCEPRDRVSPLSHFEPLPPTRPVEEKLLGLDLCFLLSDVLGRI